VPVQPAATIAPGLALALAVPAPDHPSLRKLGFAERLGHDRPEYVPDLLRLVRRQVARVTDRHLAVTPTGISTLSVSVVDSFESSRTPSFSSSRSRSLSPLLAFGSSRTGRMLLF
jgi:hypothetical protein